MLCYLLNKLFSPSTNTDDNAQMKFIYVSFINSLFSPLINTDAQFRI